MCFAWLSWLIPELFSKGSSSSSSASTSGSDASGLKTHNLAEFVRELVTVSEKAAYIARACRAEHALFQFLVEEKKEDKNTRFVQDFKTLADVLIQETVRYYLASKYPEISNNLHGEEEASFTNPATNETVTITVKGDKKQTREVLELVLGKTEAAATAAKLLSDIVYSDIPVVIPNADRLSSSFVDFSPSQIGIWIDPIDGTNEYVKGEVPEIDEEGIFPGGLPVVTVLIGAYDLNTGVPLAGVINQPFWKKTNEQWTGRIAWGLSKDGVKAFNDIPTQSPNPSKASLLVMSSSESKQIKDKASASYKLRYPAGAGYKFLAVIEGAADGYILSKNSTYKWDTCGPHAIMLARGGGMTQPDGSPVSYHKRDNGEKKYNNSKGFAAWGPQRKQADLASLLA